MQLNRLLSWTAVASFVGGARWAFAPPPLSSAGRWRPTNRSVDPAGPGRVYGASFGPQARKHDS